MTEEEYCYEGSVEHVLKLHDNEIRRQEISFGLQRNGRVCQEHMRFSRETLEWEMNYDPYHCGLRGCIGMYPILGHELDKKRGNVFYDVKISYLRNDLNGTLFEGQVDTQIIKGKKLFDHPVSMDICKICARLCQDRIKCVPIILRSCFSLNITAGIFPLRSRTSVPSRGRAGI